MKNTDAIGFNEFYNAMDSYELGSDNRFNDIPTHELFGVTEEEYSAYRKLNTKKPTKLPKNLI